MEQEQKEAEEKGKGENNEKEKTREEIEKELIAKYNINLEKLEQEQLKLAKNLSLKDSIDFSLAERVAGIENVYFKNKIVSAIVVIVNGEIIEQEYFEDKIRFPYISGFRAYRELPSMVSAFNKLNEKPDIVFVHGNGILHPRGLGLASHFALSCNIPTIGIADSLNAGEIKGEEIILNNRLVGKKLITKQGANPIYISPGNNISLKTAVELAKKFIKEPHKIPEPLRLARRYAKDVRKEVFSE